MTVNPHAEEQARRRWEEGYVGVRRSLWLRRKRLRRLVRCEAGERILELGCGDGLNLSVLEGLGFRRVLGVEYSFELLIRSSRRGVAAGDGQLLPLRSSSLDCLLVDNVLHHLPDWEAGATEIARVLRPGGAFFAIEPRPGWLRTLLDGMTFSPVSRWLAYLGSRRRTIAEEWDLYSRWLREHEVMESLLRDAGLESLERRRGPLGIFLSYRKLEGGRQSR
jgi:SAM-dependent methyltransferase